MKRSTLMRVLWLVRNNLTRQPGGDTVQILQTAAALRRIGLTVDLCERPDPDLRGYDCVHLFHLDRLWENEAHCRRIAARGVPAVLSTIYWPGDDYDRGGRTGFQGFLARTFGSEAYRSLRVAQRWAMALRSGRGAHGRWRPTVSFRHSARFVLRTVSVLLPNSRLEQEVIERYFGDVPPAVVVPNAADSSLFRPPARAWPEGRDGVLCVGRIEPRKNQLALIRAMRGSGIRLTLVGKAGQLSKSYYRRCVREAGDEVQFISLVEPAVLRDLYGAARVHANVSWYETPGLVSLEAALCGCSLVVTPGGSTREYFRNDACYARPEDPAAIRAAVEAAMTRPPDATLAARIAREYTWKAAAERTRDAYELAVARRR